MNKFLRIASLSVPLVVVAVGVTHADQGTWSLPYQGVDDNPNTPFGYATVKLTKRNGGAAAEFVTENTDTSKTSYTVHVTSPGNVTALFSQSVDGIGVLGNSVSGTGLFGSSSLGEGVFGRSPVGVGVHGNTDSGTGVIGESIDGDGIRGDAQTYGTGVLGNSVDGFGVYGESVTNIGVLGESSDNAGVYGASTSGPGVSGSSSSGVGVEGSSATGYAGRFLGNVRVTGTLTKAAGRFQIDHPLDPANKYLSHSFVESPEMKNIYDGVATLDDNGEAQVELPAWFEALNENFRYQLTPIGAPGPNLHIARPVSGNTFSIGGGTTGLRVAWQVTGVRHDPYAQLNPVPVEEVKVGAERGKYLHPEAFGEPAASGSVAASASPATLE